MVSRRVAGQHGCAWRHAKFRAPVSSVCRQMSAALERSAWFSASGLSPHCRAVTSRLECTRTATTSNKVQLHRLWRLDGSRDSGRTEHRLPARCTAPNLPWPATWASALGPSACSPAQRGTARGPTFAAPLTAAPGDREVIRKRAASRRLVLECRPHALRAASCRRRHGRPFRVEGACFIGRAGIYKA